MKDVVIEWYIPYVISKRQMLIKAVMVSSALVFFIDALVFMAVMLLPSLIIGVTGFFLFRSWRYEYEYVYVNGDFTISKIIRKEKRKDVFHADRMDMEAFVRGRREDGRTAGDFTSGREGREVYSMKVKGAWIYIEPSPEFVEEMSKYYRQG